MKVTFEQIQHFFQIYQDLECHKAVQQSIYPDWLRYLLPFRIGEAVQPR